jgi:ORF6N domain
MESGQDTVVLERIESRILLIRGQRVILAEDLATLYEVEVRALNQAVARNAERFPADFMFQLTGEEVAVLKSQVVISNTGDNNPLPGHGGRRHPPYAFTEQGVAMLSSVLRSPRAILVNVEIMRAFVRIRRMLSSNADLAWKLAALEKKYDAQFKVVFDAIRALMTPPDAKKRRSVGFGPPGQNSAGEGAR